MIEVDTGHENEIETPTVTDFRANYRDRYDYERSKSSMNQERPDT